MSTETLRPNAAGDETSISSQYPFTGQHWDKVDEETADDDTTRIYTSSASYLRDLYNLPASSGSGTINYIKVYFRCHWYSNSSAYAKPSIKSNSTVTDGTEVALDSAWTTYSQQWNTNPATGQPWTWDEIDALQIGVSLKGNTSPYSVAVCTQVYVEVDYTGAGATEKTSSDAGSGVEDTPVQSAILASSETGAGIEALIARLLAAFDNGTSAEASEIGGGGLLKELFATELGEGSDALTAKIEMPTKGGGMRLWT